MSPKTRERIIELVVNVTAVMEGKLSDWPANIQDGVYRALADKCLETKRDFVIVHSYCDKDIDTGPYIHVIATYIEVLQ